MVRSNRLKIVFVLVCFLSTLVFSQDSKPNADNKLREKIVAAYKSGGEQGLIDFFKRNQEKIINKFIVDFAKAGVKERKEEWLTVCKIMAEEKRDEKTLADVLYQTGKYFNYISNHTKAGDYLDKALHIYINLNDPVGQGYVYFNKGLILHHTGNKSEALKLYEKALPFFEKSGTDLGLGHVYKSKGDIHFRTGNNSKALELYEKALPLYEKAGAYMSQGNIYLKKGEISFRIGENEKALGMFDKALLFYENVNSSIGQGNVYWRKGLMYLRIGDNLKALEMYNQAQLFFQKAGQLVGQGNVYAAKGEIYFRMGDKSRVMEMYDKALLFFKKAGQYVGQGDVYLGKANFYLRINENSKALELFNKALSFFEKARYPIGQGNVYQKKGEIYFTNGENSKAIEMYDKALSFFEKTGWILGQAHVYMSKGDVYINNKDFSKSLEMCNKAIPLYMRVGDIETESNALLVKAKVLLKMGKNKEVLDIFEKGISKLEKVRVQTAFPKMKRAFMEKIYWQYKESVLFMLENKFYEKGFKYAESMKSRVFLDQMAEGLVPLEKGLKPELKEEMDKLTGKLSALTKQMQETGGKDEKKLKELKEEYHQVESQFEDLLIKIRLENPLYAAVNYPQPVTVRDLQMDILKKEETLLSYFISPEKAYAFIVSKENFKVKQLKVKKKEINGYVDRYLHSLKESNTNEMNRFGSNLYEKLFKPLEKYLKKSKEIIIVPEGKLETIPFESFIIAKKKSGQPVFLPEKYRMKYLQSASLLSILRKHYQRNSDTRSFIGFGDPVYDYENFRQGKPEQGSMQILATENTEGVAPPTYYCCRNTQMPEKKFWNENKVLQHSNTEVTESIFSHEDTRSDTKEKRLSSVPSVSSVAIEDEIKEIHRDRYARAGGIMDRLPHSGEEIKTIARLFEKESLKSVVHLREQAAEENAKAANMKNFDYIHFSCHGLLNDDFQSLVLSQLPPDKSKEDGYFTLNEIMNCDYNAKLVVLSACETGSGKMYKGEGVTGLTRAVMYAGTPAVVASLWKVDDIATKELMVRFYKNLLEKKWDKVEALRQAKLELLKNENYRSPLYWSAFVLYGE